MGGRGIGAEPGYEFASAFLGLQVNVWGACFPYGFSAMQDIFYVNKLNVFCSFWGSKSLDPNRRGHCPGLGHPCEKSPCPQRIQGQLYHPPHQGAAQMWPQLSGCCMDTPGYSGSTQDAQMLPHSVQMLFQDTHISPRVPRCFPGCPDVPHG